MNNALLKRFMDIVQIDSPSGEEQAMGRYLSNWLTEMGYTYTTDKLGSILTTNFENPKLLLCAHTDTVEPGRGIKPILENNYIKSEGKTILGADNKASVSAIMTAIEEYKEKYKTLPNLEILFTVKEETGGGAEFFPFNLIKSKRGLIFDYCRPHGKIIISSPFIYNFKINFKGKAAHSSRPEDGKNSLLAAVKFISEIPMGKLDNGDTTINVGQVNSGTGINVIPENTTVWGEVRSIDEKLFKKYLAQIENKAKEIAKNSDITLEYKLDGYCPGYNYSPEDKFIKEIVSVYKALGIEATYDRSTGISDANPLVGAGIETVNLSDSGENPHSTDECISIVNLNKLQEIVLKMIETFAQN